VLYPPYAPHISEFKQVLEQEFGCEFKRETLELGEGSSWEFVFIERDMAGEILVYPFDDYKDDMHVHGLLLLSICKYLRLDCSRWGITLSDWEDLDTTN
jgi:hypothetical protein